MAVPGVIPVTTPVPMPIVATAVLLLLQEPPERPSVKVVVAPMHIDVAPAIAEGRGLTVTMRVAAQPVPLKVKVIVAVPAERLVTAPVVEPTVATAVALLLHVPEPDASLSMVAPPKHKAAVPVIAAGAPLTVTTAVL